MTTNWSDETAVFRGVDKLHRAALYLRFSIGIDTPPAEAAARFDAWSLINHLQVKVIDELERDWRKERT
jgi:hypothetical protein